MTNTNSVSKTRSKTKGFKIGVKAGVDAVGGNAEYSQSQTDSVNNTRATQDGEAAFQNFQKSSGSNWQKSTTDEYYRPHQIAVYKFKRGEETISLNEDFSVFLQLNDYDQAEMDSGTPISLTEKTFEKRMPKSSDIPGYEGCPVGAVLPFFGRTPPPGWTWIDPTVTYPNTAAFPEVLHDKYMPDMTKAVFMGTAATEKELGDVVIPTEQTHFGKISIESFEADIEGEEKIDVGSEHITKDNFARLTDKTIQKLKNDPQYGLDTLKRFGWTYPPQAPTRQGDTINRRESPTYALDLSKAIDSDKKLDIVRNFIAKSEPWWWYGYLPSKVVVNSVGEKTRALIPKIDIPEGNSTKGNSTVSIDPGKPENLPPMVKCRWIIRVR